MNTDLIRENLAILSGLTPNTTTSMQKDMAAGKTSEIDELIYDVVRIADNCGIELSNYRKIATYFGYK
ncbi:ketopantoate reductase C-terminal domain-containing protein [Desulfosporosinus sp. BG]|uniref:ketopantoate reductase family protein n=1 Tax=Desulfosporosinus sp. BG TaxID=1633135 RepID=UPI000859156D|nr:ketopantoate reductase C-terminal domain-containing protein [Desulfosporosinus sp. BG]ODA41881.1 hypothetical protein DSBG_1373 [Desulfosporosinus sp. BG]